MAGFFSKSPISGDVSGVGASAGVNSDMSVGTHIAHLEEKLSVIEDEKAWNRIHIRLLISHNFRSIMFWVLSCATLCFAVLNAYYGYSSSLAIAGGFMSAIAIGAIYFIIELTVPISAHLMSWGAKGESRWVVRIVGSACFSLGVVFSLLVLQGKFAGTAAGGAVKAGSAALLLDVDKGQLSRANATIAELKGKVGARSAESYLAEMRSILSTQIGKKTLGDITDECQGPKRDNKTVDLCGRYEKARSSHADAIALARAEDIVEKSSTKLASGDRFNGIGGDAQDKVVSRLMGSSIENVQLFKGSIMALFAALLTHLLWAAFGITVNAEIARERESLIVGNSLIRAIARKKDEQATTQRDIEREKLDAVEATKLAFELAKKPTEVKSNKSAINDVSGLSQHSILVQLQEFLISCCVISPSLKVSVGILHDNYAQWCTVNGHSPIQVDKLVQLLRELKITVETDGSVCGVAIKS